MTNRRNFLLRVREVNEVYLLYSKRGVFTEKIYRLYVRDRFYISRATFFRYLTIPYKKELADANVDCDDGVQADKRAVCCPENRG